MIQESRKKTLNFNIINETEAHLPSIDFLAIKNSALGKNYFLNLIFTNSAKMKKLNTIYRNKECSTDILSFPISSKEGEIYISPSDAKKEAKKFQRKYDNFIAFLFIHGCVHLKGHDHSAIMDDIESKLHKEFKI